MDIKSDLKTFYLQYKQEGIKIYENFASLVTNDKHLKELKTALFCLRHKVYNWYCAIYDINSIKSLKECVIDFENKKFNVAPEEITAETISNYEFVVCKFEEDITFLKDDKLINLFDLKSALFQNITNEKLTGLKQEIICVNVIYDTKTKKIDTAYYMQTKDTIFSNDINNKLSWQIDALAPNQDNKLIYSFNSIYSINEVISEAEIQLLKAKVVVTSDFVLSTLSNWNTLKQDLINAYNNLKNQLKDNMYDKVYGFVMYDKAYGFNLDTKKQKVTDLSYILNYDKDLIVKNELINFHTLVQDNKYELFTLSPNITNNSTEIAWEVLQAQKEIVSRINTHNILNKSLAYYSENEDDSNMINFSINYDDKQEDYNFIISSKLAFFITFITSEKDKIKLLSDALVQYHEDTNFMNLINQPATLMHNLLNDSIKFNEDKYATLHNLSEFSNDLYLLIDKKPQIVDDSKDGIVKVYDKYSIKTLIKDLQALKDFEYSLSDFITIDDKNKAYLLSHETDLNVWLQEFKVVHLIYTDNNDANYHFDISYQSSYDLSSGASTLSLNYSNTTYHEENPNSNVLSEIRFKKYHEDNITWTILKAIKYIGTKGYKKDNELSASEIIALQHEPTFLDDLSTIKNFQYKDYNTTINSIYKDKQSLNSIYALSMFSRNTFEQKNLYAIKNEKDEIIYITNLDADINIMIKEAEIEHLSQYQLVLLAYNEKMEKIADENLLCLSYELYGNDKGSLVRLSPYTLNSAKDNFATIKTWKKDAILSKNDLKASYFSEKQQHALSFILGFYSYEMQTVNDETLKTQLITKYLFKLASVKEQIQNQNMQKKKLN